MCVIRSRATVCRKRIHIYGAVQGVGFRPFVYTLAQALGLSGWVQNTPTGVVVEIQGAQPTTQTFLTRLQCEQPIHAVILALESVSLPPRTAGGFEIRESEATTTAQTLILPDLTTCAACLQELYDPTDRRYRYPFINCTHCGPRYSLIERLPYDRGNTTMKDFAMCPECAAEYNDPMHRRFHAQPIACPACGPQLTLLDDQGHLLARQEEALCKTSESIRAGQIVAMKGLGGFHLLADARNPEAITRLRQRKHRPGKPLAIMYPSLPKIYLDCDCLPEERDLLTSTAAPIVLVKRRSECALPDAVAPGNPWLGVMLPYTPLHHLLLSDLDFPVIATSANISGEPLCIDTQEACRDLRGIADSFLVHDRPIRRAVDDSVVRIIADRTMLLRRSRGYVPLPVQVPYHCQPVIAVGADLKNTIALARGKQIFLSQHIGDLATKKSLEAHERAIEDLPAFYPSTDERIACDGHPGFHSTRLAQTLTPNPILIQHHHAHIAACMAEHGIDEEVLGVAWDGLGYGTDNTLWGGEFLLATPCTFQHLNGFRSFPLPGGEKAPREPRLTALGLLHEADLQDIPEPLKNAFESDELTLLQSMLKHSLNCPRTSSAGRLFDAVSALLGLTWKNSFEGQAAMALEFAMDGVVSDEAYAIVPSPPFPIDWSPMLHELLSDLRRNVATAHISIRFHNTLAASVSRMATLADRRKVVLSGGCCQNRYLLERCISVLRSAGFEPFWPHQVPPNDGGIAFGQAVIAGLQPNEEKSPCV